jgi:hypothetical protein
MGELFLTIAGSASAARREIFAALAGSGADMCNSFARSCVFVAPKRANPL